MISAKRRYWLLILSLTGLAACGGDEGVDGLSSRTSQTIAFSAGDGVSTNGTTEMYAVQDDGSGLLRLSDDSPFERTLIRNFAVSPDSQWVAYVMDTSNFGDTGIFVSPIAGGTAVRVSGTRTDGTSIIESFDWSPDSTQIVYAANIDTPFLSGFANEVFVVDRNGVNNIKISGSVGSPVEVEVRNPKWSPDGRFVLQDVATYTNNSDSPNPFALNLWDSTAAQPNSSRIVTSTNQIIRNASWSSDSSRIGYVANHEASNTFRAYTIAATALENEFVPVSMTAGFNDVPRWSPSGARLAFLDHPTNDFPVDLIVSNTNSGNSRDNLTFLADTDRRVYDYRWSPEGTSMAYTSDEETLNQRELYVINSQGSGMAMKVSGPQLPSSDVFEFKWSPNGRFIAYVADASIDTIIDLYVANVATGEIHRISTGLTGEEVVDFDWSFDSRRLAFSTGPSDRTVSANKLYVSQPDSDDFTEITSLMTSQPLNFRYD